MRSMLLVLAVAHLTGPALWAQRPPDLSAREREAMAKLSFLVGDWEGPASVQAGPDRRIDLRQTEMVRYELDGVILRVEGRGVVAASGETQFHAHAIISWEEGRGYRMRSWLRTGQESEFVMTVQDSGFVWGHEAPTGQVRYTMRLTPEGEWHEAGEFSPDGTRWFPTIEMRLRRVAPKP